MGLLDLIFPKYCVNCKKVGSYLCPDCFSYLSFDAESICLVCNRPSIDGLTHPVCFGYYIINGVFTSINYKGVAKKLIYNFKYRPYLTNLQSLLVDLFYESLIQKEEFNRIYEKEGIDKIILVPIPLYREKLKSRGYNQTEILAEGLSEKLNLRVLNILERIKDTHSQVGLSKKERKENIKDAFKIKTEAKDALKGKTVFLVDDVLTTGSTLFEAAKILKRNKAKNVWGLALAKD